MERYIGMDELVVAAEEFQAAFSAPPILGILTSRPRRGYWAGSRAEDL